MKVLLTGGSSLTGYWFAKELQSQGHEVICTLTRKTIEDYAQEKSYLRARRLVANGFEIFWDVEFGTVKFCDLLRTGRYDILCLHGAYIPDYRSDEFKIAEAMHRNLLNIHQVFSLLAKGSTPFVLTGTVFEPGEGDFGRPTEPVSPYGLAKHLIGEIFEFYSKKFKVPMAKFVVPNPIGPLEDRKFTGYLVDSWKKNETPVVKTPLYVRDNIHVQLLARAYADLVDRRAKRFFDGEVIISRPSGYCESQGEFTERFAREMRLRLGLPCQYELAHQSEFLEPLSRVNSESIINKFSDFSEKQAWDELAEYYKSN